MSAKAKVEEQVEEQVAEQVATFAPATSSKYDFGARPHLVAAEVEQALAAPAAFLAAAQAVNVTCEPAKLVLRLTGPTEEVLTQANALRAVGWKVTNVSRARVSTEGESNDPLNIDAGNLYLYMAPAPVGEDGKPKTRKGRKAKVVVSRPTVESA